MKTKLILMICILLTVFINIPAYTSDKTANAVMVKVGSNIAYINNQKTMIDTDNKHVVPIIRNDRTLVPVRFISESFGAQIDWDNDAQTATILYNGKTIKLTVDSDTMFVDDNPIILDSPAISYNYRIFIPLRRLCEDALGKQIFYNYHLIVVSDTPSLIDPEAEHELVDRLHGMFKGTDKLNYMIYYAELNDEIIEMAKNYELFILHPRMGKTTRDQVMRIQQGNNPDDPNDDVFVLGYISIGEDLRTAGATPEQMKTDPRFVGDGTGPRTDPRSVSNSTNFDGIDPVGVSSKGGTGYASWYLDDNNFDGLPDINNNFKCAFTNIGDPAWYDVLNTMTMDGVDGIPGMKEILTLDYGRGLGCDGLFLDTVDTCAPNSYTDENSWVRSEFEWTAPGYLQFMKKLKFAYPDKLTLQNRGVFFFDPRLPHYKYNTGKQIDFLMYESFMLDSNPAAPFHEGFYADNKNAYMPKLMAEAGRPGGFRVVSLGYAEGPPELMLKETLLGQSDTGSSLLAEDIHQAEELAGFRHYITDGGLVLTNDYVRNHRTNADNTAPVWSSVYNDSIEWPPHEPAPRVGIRETVPVNGGITVRWDVALDKNNVHYNLYLQEDPFSFEDKPDLSDAKKITLKPKIGAGYVNGATPTTYPYEDTITGLQPGIKYYLLIRACDDRQNEEKNTVVLECIPQ